jgi:hypothetical protein
VWIGYDFSPQGKKSRRVEGKKKLPGRSKEEEQKA